MTASASLGSIRSANAQPPHYLDGDLITLASGNYQIDVRGGAEFALVEYGNEDFRFETHWDDPHSDASGTSGRSRSEIVGMDNYAYGATHWIAFDRQVVDYTVSHDAIMGQIHAPQAGFGPVSTFAVNPGKNFKVGLSYRQTGQSVDTSTTLWTGELVTDNLGVWENYIIKLQQHNSAGIFKVWRRLGSAAEQVIIDYTGPVGYTDAAAPTRFQFGVYSQSLTNAGVPVNPIAARFRNIKNGTTPLHA